MGFPPWNVTPDSLPGSGDHRVKAEPAGERIIPLALRARGKFRVESCESRVISQGLSIPVAGLSTLNTELSTLNSELSTLNSELSTLNS